MNDAAVSRAGDNYNGRPGAALLVIIILGSGASAGLIYGMVGVAVVGPYLDAATELEYEAEFGRGASGSTPEVRAEYELYREWQRGGHVAASVAYGVAFGSLFGAVFAVSEKSLPGKGPVPKAVLLAGMMWVAIFMIPFAKYPPNPPATGDPDTVVLRTMLYLVLVAASGLGALAFAKMSSHLARARGLAPGRAACIGIACYAAFAIVLVALMPPGPDPDPDLDPQLLSGFRIMSAAGVASFWVSAGVILGLFWRLRLGRLPGRRGTQTESRF